MRTDFQVFEKTNFEVEGLEDADLDNTMETFTVFMPTDSSNLTRVQEDYDYDMETSHNIFFWDELLPTLIVYCLTFILGLVGNVLIVFTISRYRKMKSTTNVFLASLASSDLLLILFCIPVKKLDSSFEIPNLNFRPRIKEERLKGSKSRKRDNVNSNLKTILKPQTARDASKTRAEVKRFRKPSDRVRRQLAMTCWKDVGKVEMAEGVETSTSSVRKESSEVAVMEVSRVKNSPRKGKKKNEEKGNKSTGQTEKESGKEFERKVRKQKTKKLGEDEYYHLPLGEFSDDRTKELNESPGKAVVIYQRENRRKCLNPQKGDGFQYEQISFAGTHDLTQSQKSFSEPRHNSLTSLKDLYVSRRRTRFHMEPVKPSPTHSDFQSTVNMLKEYRASSEYQKFSDNVENTKCVAQSYKTSTEDGRVPKGCQVVRESMGASSSHKTPTDKEEVAARLKETAKKKLNLHREMIRAEKKNKKKFWESIQRSLNYRCALAEMLSSTQSFLSHNELSRMVSSSTGQSTRQEILVQECVIDNISNYQSPENPENPKTKRRKEAKVKTHSSPPSPLGTYRIVRKRSPPRLVPEDELEEKIIATHDLDNLTFELTSQSSIIPTENMFNVSTSSLRGTTSGKCNLLERSLVADANPSSELESLMAKLSQEIRRCSHFIKELNSSEQTTDPQDKQIDSLSCKISVSDSKLEVVKGYESRREMFSENEKSGEGLNTIMVYRVAESMKKESKMNHGKVGSKKGVNDSTVEVKHSRKKDWKGKNREKGAVKAEPLLKRVASNGSYYSSCVSSSTSSSIISRKVGRSANREMICCDYCKFLKKRIFKLEKDLERIEKILPFYPAEYQDSLKDCLERLKTASDCVLKRLKSCAKSRHELHQKEASEMSVTGDAKRPRSAPMTRDQSQTREKFCLRSSTSENEVSLGTESVGVTTEPTSELSEEKAVQSDAPKVTDRVEVMKEAQPSFVVETHYPCPPTTGTTVKTFSDNASSNPSLDLALPAVGMKELNLKSSETPTQTNGNSSVAVGKDGSTSSLKKESTNSSQEQSSREESKYMKEPEDGQTSSSPPSEMSDSKKEEPAQDKVMETEVTSLFPGSGESVVIEKGKAEMGKSKTSEKKERPKWSRIPTRRKATPNNSLQQADSVSVNSSWGSLSKSEGNSVQHESERPFGSSQKMTSTKSSKIGHRKEKIIRCKRKMKVDKSTQIYVKCESGRRAERCLSDAGTQTEGKFDGTTSSTVTKDDKQVQTCPQTRMPSRMNLRKRGSSTNSSDVASQVDFIGCSLLSQATTVTNVSIQTSQPDGMTITTANVAVQTNLPTEEEMKYQKDLNVQKKVNMAIAELCFHLSQTKQGKA